MTLYVGDDWSEDHHDIQLMNEACERLAARRLPEGVAGVAALHELIAEHADQLAPWGVSPLAGEGIRRRALEAVFRLPIRAGARGRSPHRKKVRGRVGGPEPRSALVRDGVWGAQPPAGDTRSASESPSP